MKMPNLLLIGGDTSLGKAFREECHKRKILVFQIPVAEMRNDRVLRELIPDDTYKYVVNCHGRNRLARLGEMEWMDKDKVSFTNSLLVENVAPILWVINELVRRGHPGARVLSVASQTYRVAQTNTALYCASKAALVQLSKVMARELAERGWVINCLAPGKITDTRMAALTDAQVEGLRNWSVQEAERYALRNIPMRRFTHCAEVVEAMFGILALPAYINGACIDMTGGA